MLTASSRQRSVALLCYFLSAFLVLGFLLPLGDSSLGMIVGCCYIPLSLGACVGACCFPLRFCTVLKAVGLAGFGALLPVLLLCGPYFYTHIFRAT